MAYRRESQPLRGGAIAVAVVAALFGGLSIGGFVALALIPFGPFVALKWELFGPLAAVAIPLAAVAAGLLLINSQRHESRDGDVDRGVWKLIVFSVIGAVVPLIALTITQPA